MKSFLPLLGSLFAAGALWATPLHAAYSIAEPFSETRPFDAHGEIVLSNINGRVTIRTWDRAEVKIEGEKRAKTDEELKRIELSIDARPASLAVKTYLPKRTGGWFGESTIRAEVEITLTVPATARLKKIENVNGNIDIEGLRGAVSAETVNGSLHARGLAGDASLRTVNGAIHADFASVAEKQSISAHTVNGTATVALPKNASIVLRASSVNGSISCDFPIKLEGKVSRKQLRGSVGSGSASLNAETVNGSIRVTTI